MIRWITDWLPKRIIYYCAIKVWVCATTGKYGDTIVSEITMSEALARFSRIYALPGHGKDEHYDSNRNRYRAIAV